MKTIGTLEVIEIPDEGKRFLIHLSNDIKRDVKKSVNIIGKIRTDMKTQPLSIGKYSVSEDFKYERF